MSTIILHGEEAIHFAEVHGLSLNERADESHPVRTGLSVAEARRIQDQEGGHIWLETKIGVNSGEHVEH